MKKKSDGETKFIMTLEGSNCESFNVSIEDPRSN